MSQEQALMELKTVTDELSSKCDSNGLPDRFFMTGAVDLTQTMIPVLIHINKSVQAREYIRNELEVELSKELDIQKIVKISSILAKGTSVSMVEVFTVIGIVYTFRFDDMFNMLASAIDIVIEEQT